MRQHLADFKRPDCANLLTLINPIVPWTQFDSDFRLGGSFHVTLLLKHFVRGVSVALHEST